jgi:hypothetical protein
MADGKITVRPSLDLIKKTVLDHQIHHRYARQITKFAHDLFSGVNRYPKPWELHKPFSVPKRLKPSDLDWHRSCFKVTWSIAIRPDIAPMLWHISIELCSVDVTKVLCARTNSAERTHAEAKSGSGAKTRGIAEAITQLWPNGTIPNGLSAKDRNRAIIDRMRQNGSSIPLKPERAIQRVLKARRSN